MSYKPPEQYDPQFEAELEKAKALSLEMYELEQIRQKRFSHSGSSSSSTNYSATDGPSGSSASAVPTNIREYKSYLERKLGRPLSGGNPDSWKPPAPTQAGRRSSEITPPSMFEKKFESDLMDFNAPSPEKPKDSQSEAHESFIQLVQQMHQ